jgi:hypothetical protein
VSAIIDSTINETTVTPWSRVLFEIIVCSATEEIPVFLQNLKVHHQIHKPTAKEALRHLLLTVWEGDKSKVPGAYLCITLCRHMGE